MYSGIPYGDFCDLSGCRVSIDNVRMKFAYKAKRFDFEAQQTVDTLDQLRSRINGLFYQGCDTSYKSCDFFRIGNYAGTFTISGEDWSCAVLMGRYTFDTSVKQIAPEAVFDFNPNKVPSEVVSEILRRLKDGARKIQVVRYDIAFDFPIDRGEVFMVKNNRQCYRRFEDRGAVTEYQGERSHHKATKVYDKTKEHGLSSPVTRCEITVDGDFRESLATIFPTLYSFTNYQLDTGFQDLPFQVQACIIHPDLLPLLLNTGDSKTRKKYKAILETTVGQLISPEEWKTVDRFARNTLIQYKKAV